MFLPLAVVCVAVVCIFAKQKKLGKLSSPKLSCLKLNLDSRICKYAETRGSGQKVGQVHSRICKSAETRHGPMSPWAHGPWAYEHMAHGPMGPWAHGPWAWVTIGQCAHGSLGALRQRPRIHVGWADLSVNVTTVNVVVARH